MRGGSHVSTDDLNDATFERIGPRTNTRHDREGEAMSPEVRESRAALILLAAAVGAVLLFGAFTLLTQLG